MALVAACLENKRKAQKELYDRYKDAMYTLAYRVLDNFDEAADALQEGFIQVFASLERYRGESSLGAWIRTIIVRAAYKKMKPVWNFEDVDAIPEPDDQLFDDNLTGNELERAILGLSDGYRLVFNLIEVEGYKHHEVAKMLNISVGTSKSQLYHAKKKLQQELAFLVE